MYSQDDFRTEKEISKTKLDKVFVTDLHCIQKPNQLRNSVIFWKKEYFSK